MIKSLGFAILLALAGCSVMPQHQQTASTCSASPGGYDCQVHNYFRAP
jgi:hypothetical protein